MAGKEFTFAFQITSKLAKGFGNAFSEAYSQTSKLYNNYKSYKQIFESVNDAYRQGIINVESYNNALSKIPFAYKKAFENPDLPRKMTESFVRGKALRTLGGAGMQWATNTSAKLFELTKEAREFEEAMADVRKVVDFDSQDQFKSMSKDILNMSTRIPMAANDLAQIVAAGGQSGIARQDLTAFAESAAKMGIAFDITADQAGEMMAKWRTAFKMNQTQVETLADKINYLGNTTAASAPLISDVVTRIGPLGAVGGLASGEIAAMGASLVGAGIQSEVAATGLKNFILTMASGESATKTQHEAFARLGLDAEDMAAKMQKNAKGAIIEVLTAINSIDKVKQSAVLKDLFGKESIGAIAPLLTNLDNLKSNFDAVADSAKYTGSMNAEFEARSKTTANSLKLLENNAKALKTSFGSALLPTIQTLASGTGGLASAITKYANEHPALTNGIATFAVGVVGLVAGISALTYAFGTLSFAFNVGKAGIDMMRKSTLLYDATTKIVSVSVKAWSLVQGVLNAVIAACPIGWLLIGLAALVVVGTAIYRNWDTIKAKWTECWNSFSQSYPKIAKIFEGIASVIATPFRLISSFVDKIKEAIGLGPSLPTGDSLRSLKGDGVVRNATGGIYGKGAFLTTFAEKSGESAIPHTLNRRNVSLLAKTNEIMGNPLGGGGINATFAPVINVSGGADAGQISQLMDDKMREFEAMLKRIADNRRRMSYA